MIIPGIVEDSALISALGMCLEFLSCLISLGILPIPPILYIDRHRRGYKYPLFSGPYLENRVLSGLFLLGLDYSPEERR